MGICSPGNWDYITGVFEAHETKDLERSRPYPGDGKMANGYTAEKGELP
jgi:hypothetical protein